MDFITKAEATIHKSDRIDFKIIKAIKDKDGHYIMFRDITNQEEITIINIGTTNESAEKHKAVT